MPDLEDLRDAMRKFTAERDWERFHDPKSLLLALVGDSTSYVGMLDVRRVDDTRTQHRA